MDLSLGCRPAPLGRSRRAWPWAAAALGVLALSCNEFALVDLMHRANLPQLAEAAGGVLEGRPHWAANQGRLLGPLALRGVEWLQHAMLPQESEPHFALRLFFLIAICAKNGALFALTALQTRSLPAALALTLAGSVLFLLFGDGWLFPWDFFDVAILSGLAFLIQRWEAPEPRSMALFLFLFLPALVNRESAAFFGLWLICMGAARLLLAKRGRLAGREIAAGALLIATTAAYAAIVRAWLLVEETGGAHYQGVRIAGNYLQLGPNLYAIAENLLTPRLYIDAWIALLLLYGAALAAWGVREASPRRLAQGLFALGLLAAVLCFGIVNEARVFLIFVPFLVFSLAEYGTAMARSLRDGRAG
jgi:hypothetical protein